MNRRQLFHSPAAVAVAAGIPKLSPQAVPFMLVDFERGIYEQNGHRISIKEAPGFRFPRAEPSNLPKRGHTTLSALTPKGLYVGGWPPKYPLPRDVSDAIAMGVARFA